MITVTADRGHCSECHKVWTLKEGRGVCRWCGQPARCQTTTTKPRQVKSSRRRKQRQTNNNNNGYHQLPDQQGWIATPNGFRWATVQWATLYDVARCYAKKAKTQDTEDLLHDIILALAQVLQRKQAQGQPFSTAAMHRTAEHVKDWYWYRHYAYTTGLNCRHCTKEQQAKCRYNWAHSDWAYADCHKAIQLESLNQPITDSEGNMTELGDLMADDRALDLEEWLDARTFLIGAPIRLKAIARKLHSGVSLDNRDKCYLRRFRQKSQKVLF